MKSKGKKISAFIIIIIIIAGFSKSFCQTPEFTFNGAADVIFRYPPRGNGGRAIVHDDGNVLSLNYGGDFTGGTRIGNSFHVANDGAISGTSASFNGLFSVRTAGTGTWGDFVIKSTSFWGDGCSSPSEIAGTQYTTIGSQAAGIMFYNPHVVWNQNNNAAAIRYGRSGGISSGSWWEAGVNSSGGFHILKEAGNIGFSIDNTGSGHFNGLVSLGSGTNGGVENTVYVGGHNNIWRFGNATEYGMAYYQGINNPWGSDAIGFHFGDRNSPKFYVQNNGNTTINGLLKVSNATIDGNLGIGTVNPAYKLDVTGTIRAQEVKVNLNAPGPDYVFEKDYQLPSLAETQKYIQENKHLPEVPSAKEMEANGINLSEMNMLLLKKVEELTLHLIEQEERIRRLEVSNIKRKKPKIK